MDYFFKLYSNVRKRNKIINVSIRRHSLLISLSFLRKICHIWNNNSFYNNSLLLTQHITVIWLLCKPFTTIIHAILKYCKCSVFTILLKFSSNVLQLFVQNLHVVQCRLLSFLWTRNTCAIYCTYCMSDWFYRKCIFYAKIFYLRIIPRVCFNILIWFESIIWLLKLRLLRKQNACDFCRILHIIIYYFLFKSPSLHYYCKLIVMNFILLKKSGGSIITRTWLSNFNKQWCDNIPTNFFLQYSYRNIMQ